MSQPLDKVFNPGSVAIIGASEVPGKASERRTRSLLQGGYRGEVYLINPKRTELFSRKAYPSILDVGKPVDLVIIILAPRLVVSAVADSVKAGAKGVIIITAGLGETGDEGKKNEAEILKEAARTGTFIIGPNCSGMFSASAEMNLLGVPPLQKGNISILAQSGNVIDSLTHYAQMRGLGFSKIISAGNAIGVEFHQYISYLADDQDTKVIIAYLEAIKNGNEFVRIARETVKRKPIALIKAGRTAAGVRAAASHTGSLAGDDAIVDAAFRQAGITRVSNIDELFDIAQAFLTCPLPRGNRVAILSEGGGDNAIAADNAEKYGLDVPVLAEITQKKMRPFLLEGMPASNPIDYGGTAEENPHMIAECVNVAMQDDQVDAVFITGFFGGFKDIIAPHVGALEEETSRELVELVKKYQKPLFVHTSFARDPVESLRILSSSGIPVMDSSGRTAQVLSALVKFVMKQESISRQKISSVEPGERSGVKAILDTVRGEGRVNLLETESREMLREYAIALPNARLARNSSEAGEIYDEFGQPLAMKVVSPDIVHKSDAGGVRLGLSTREEVEKAFDEILFNVEKVTRRDRVLGMLLSPMMSKGQECIIGMVRDPQFGPVIMFGLGGIFVEVLKDVSFRVAPLTAEDIEEMIQEIKGYRILTGIRGEAPKDIDSLKDILAKLSQIAIDNPEIQEIDLNPVIVHQRGASIVDSRVIIGQSLAQRRVP
jgi:acetyltransferase